MQTDLEYKGKCIWCNCAVYKDHDTGKMIWTGPYWCGCELEKPKNEKKKDKKVKGVEDDED